MHLFFVRRETNLKTGGNKNNSFRYPPIPLEKICLMKYQTLMIMENNLLSV
jgi:hypothetical protein